MITSHMQMLNKAGLALLEKASGLEKIGDIEKCVKIGTELLEKAREIMESQKLNSIVVFAEMCISAEAEIKYEWYCEFCVRNSLEMYSRIDFDNRLVRVGEIMKV